MKRALRAKGYGTSPSNLSNKSLCALQTIRKGIDGPRMLKSTHPMTGTKSKKRLPKRLSLARVATSVAAHAWPAMSKFPARAENAAS
jgi:hypothetical protein